MFNHFASLQKNTTDPGSRVLYSRQAPFSSFSWDPCPTKRHVESKDEDTEPVQPVSTSLFLSLEGQDDYDIHFTGY